MAGMCTPARNRHSEGHEHSRRQETRAHPAATSRRGHRQPETGTCSSMVGPRSAPSRGLNPAHAVTGISEEQARQILAQGWGLHDTRSENDYDAIRIVGGWLFRKHNDLDTRRGGPGSEGWLVADNGECRFGYFWAAAEDVATLLQQDPPAPTEAETAYFNKMSCPDDAGNVPGKANSPDETDVDRRRSKKTLGRSLRYTQTP